MVQSADSALIFLSPIPSLIFVQALQMQFWKTFNHTKTQYDPGIYYSNASAHQEQRAVI